MDILAVEKQQRKKNHVACTTSEEEEEQEDNRAPASHKQKEREVHHGEGGEMKSEGCDKANLFRGQKGVGGHS